MVFTTLFQNKIIFSTGFWLPFYKSMLKWTKNTRKMNSLKRYEAPCTSTATKNYGVFPAPTRDYFYCQKPKNLLEIIIFIFIVVFNKFGFTMLWEKGLPGLPDLFWGKAPFIISKRANYPIFEIKKSRFLTV